MRAHPRLVPVVVIAVVCAAALLLVTARLRRVRCLLLATSVRADGRFYPVAALQSGLGDPPANTDVAVGGVDMSQIAMQKEAGGRLILLYRAPVRGGAVHLRLRVHHEAWNFPVTAAPDLADHVGDGFPDALRLHSADDRLRFRRWFTAIADRAAAVPSRELPAEITDCSALLRYSYRLALIQHDDRWYKQFMPGMMPVLPSVQQWNYPETTLGAALFRIDPPGAHVDPSHFAEFADAKTLYSRNSFRIGRDVHIARPGDLLFFHQLEGEQQYHSMVVTGDSGAWVVYHTGPSATGTSRDPGEMRRARVTDLLQHPDPRWHPTANNPNFLGVFRWNLLRED